MDFYKIRTREKRGGGIELYPDFVVARSKDLMLRGRSFYAIWDEERGLWSTNEYDVVRLVDQELYSEAEKYPGCTVKDMASSESNSWKKFKLFIKDVADNYVALDQNLTFLNSETKKIDYASKRLPYKLEPGDYSAWDELIGTLYSTEERAKIEWAIGAIVSGDSKKIQKFLVLYGSAGTGKSTILNVVEKLFSGYTTSFEASALGRGSSFAMEMFRTDPLVAIQHDGDLSKLEDNTLINSIVAHETMTMNEKHKAKYAIRVNALLLMGTNQPVKITDAKSGIIRRLIDVNPTGVTFPTKHYHGLMSRIEFELGAIAHTCLEKYHDMGRNFYSSYKPVSMMFATDVFYNFIEAHFDIFTRQDCTTLKQAYELYKVFCEETGIPRPMPQYKMRDELKYYFEEFHERLRIDEAFVRSYYKGFKGLAFKTTAKKSKPATLVMDETESLFDREYADCLAQGCKQDDDGNDIPQRGWKYVKTHLSDMDTTQLHYVQVPEHLIVIDFDLKDLNGTKSLERNLEAASQWPPTYAELSQGGNGVHLHYIYDGDVSLLSSQFSAGIEVKTLLGAASLRRRLTRCNNIPVATINSGLPIKEKPVISAQQVQSERGLRNQIEKNLRKETHPGTKPSIDFIKKILDDAYESGLRYDVTDMRPRILAFANNSSNHAMECLKICQQMIWVSDDTLTNDSGRDTESYESGNQSIIFFDVEVYPNLFVVCWKAHGAPAVTRMINPTPQDIEGLFKLKLVGFNNRRYDNHMLWARYMGYSNNDLFRLSQKMVVDQDRKAMFGEAYDLSYTDIWDFSSVKQGLKKFQIDLGIFHSELDLPWDQDVPDEMIDKVVEYCVNDVISTEAVFEDRAQDFVARQILTDLSGLTMNHTTAQHTARIIFGRDKDYKDEFVYTDLSGQFPGYTFDMGRSTYRDEVVGEGGYVYAEPGIYENVTVLDVASMHPTSIELLNLFGPYTRNYSALKEARLAIKRKDYEAARGMYDGKLAKHLSTDDGAVALAYALKIIINIVYGLTSSKWESAFKDKRNQDNIVAKRGALFMIDLKHYIQGHDHQVVHIKTDSVKIPKADDLIIKHVMSMGEKYGYTFERECIYDRFCLVNDAVYIARKHDGYWEAVGAQFAHPYVYKTLFSREDLTFDDYCETRSVQKGAMYLDFEHDRPMELGAEGLHFVGRTGRFVPVTEGARLLRVHEGKTYAVTGTKNYLWVEADMAKGLGLEEIDMKYFERLKDEALKAINQFEGGYDYLMDGF